MRYLVLFGILLTMALLTAGCTSETPESTNGTMQANNESMQETNPVVADQQPAAAEPVAVAEEPADETPTDTSGTLTTGNFASCLQKCGGGAGSGAYCEDGCRFEEASRTADTYYCDQLDQKDSIPECYGTVAIAAGDINVCKKLSGEDYNHCISTFLPR